MVTDKPRIIEDEMYKLLRVSDADEFNRRRATGTAVDLRGVDLRSVDLRGFDLSELDLTDCYLRQADLRGQDLRTCCLEGASLRSARISGAHFPRQLPAEEIRLSVDLGTRLRCTASGD